MGVDRDFLVFFGVEGKNFNLNGKSTTFSMGSMSEPRCYLYNDYNIIYQYISYKSIYTLYIHISLHINTYCTFTRICQAQRAILIHGKNILDLGPQKKQRAGFYVGAVGAFQAQKWLPKIHAMIRKTAKVYPRL